MGIPGRAQGRWRLRHSRKVKETRFWSHGVRNQRSQGRRREWFCNHIFLFFYFSSGWPQKPCHMAAINCSTGRVPFKYQKVYLPSQEEERIDRSSLPYCPFSVDLPKSNGK